MRKRNPFYAPMFITHAQQMLLHLIWTKHDKFDKFSRHFMFFLITFIYRSDSKKKKSCSTENVLHVAQDKINNKYSFEQCEWWGWSKLCRQRQNNTKYSIGPSAEECEWNNNFNCSRQSPFFFSRSATTKHFWTHPCRLAYRWIMWNECTAI